MSDTLPPPFGAAPPEYQLPTATTLGPVSLQVANLARSLSYYSDVIGLRIASQRESTAVLTAHDDDEPLITLHELQSAEPVPPRGRLGLFHVAILLPDRAALGRLLSHLAARNEVVGMSDHLVSEALYLTDPDGLGLEVYTDRPFDAWRTSQQQLAMASDPLDVPSVIAAGDGRPWTGAPSGTRIGHVHLHVGSLSEAEEFFHRVIGFNKTVWSFPGALFLAAGRYHHHLGTNTWARGAEPARSDEARLLEWTVVVPTVADVQALARSCERHGVPVVAATDAHDGIVVHDPWGTAMRVRSQSHA